MRFVFWVGLIVRNKYSVHSKGAPVKLKPNISCRAGSCRPAYHFYWATMATNPKWTPKTVYPQLGLAQLVWRPCGGGLFSNLLQRSDQPLFQKTAVESLDATGE